MSEYNWDQDMADRAKHSSLMWIKAEDKFKICLKWLIATNIIWLIIVILILI